MRLLHLLSWIILLVPGLVTLAAQVPHDARGIEAVAILEARDEPTNTTTTAVASDSETTATATTPGDSSSTSTTSTASSTTISSLNASNTSHGGLAFLESLLCYMLTFSLRSQEADGFTQARRASYQTLDYACAGCWWFYPDNDRRGSGVDRNSESMVPLLSFSR